MQLIRNNTVSSDCRASSTQAWHWTRVYYFESSKDALILDGVRPAIALLSTDAEPVSFYFERSCVGGPNVLIGLSSEPSQPLAGLPLYVKSLRDYIAAHPSQAEDSASELTAKMRAIAHYEARQSNAGVLQPNNLVLDGCEEPPFFLPASAELRDAARRFRCRSADLVMRWLHLIRSGEVDRESLAHKILVGVAWLCDSRSLRVHLSYRSHAEGFLRGADPDGRAAARLVRLYEDRTAVIRAMVAETVRDLKSGVCDVPFLLDYLSVVRETMYDLREGFRLGAYHTASLPESMAMFSDLLAATSRRTGRPQWTVKGPSDEIARMFSTVPELQSWRIIVNLVYTTLNQLGLWPLSRFVACYLLSRAIEDEFGISPRQVVADLSRTRSHSSFLSCFEQWNGEADAGITQTPLVS